MGEQGHDDHHGLCRGAQPIEDGTFAGAEGFVTRVTDEPLFLLRMDTDIALARLASGRTVPIGAECGCGVHDGPPGVVWKHAKRSIFGPPFSLQVRFTTVKCRATKQFNLENNDGIYPALCGRETFALLLDLCDGTGNATGCYREVLHWCVRQ